MIYVIPLGGFLGISTIYEATRLVVEKMRKEKKGKRQELSKTRLDRLAKEEFVKVRSMA